MNFVAIYVKFWIEAAEGCGGLLLDCGQGLSDGYWSLKSKRGVLQGGV